MGNMVILEESCMASADIQWPFYSGERIVAHGPLVFEQAAFVDLKLLSCQNSLCIIRISFLFIWEQLHFWMLADILDCKWIGQ